MRFSGRLGSASLRSDVRRPRPLHFIAGPHCQQTGFREDYRFGAHGPSRRGVTRSRLSAVLHREGGVVQILETYSSSGNRARQSDSIWARCSRRSASNLMISFFAMIVPGDPPRTGPCFPASYSSTRCVNPRGNSSKAAENWKHDAYGGPSCLFAFHAQVFTVDGQFITLNCQLLALQGRRLCFRVLGE
jgi:hypothetical protein